MTTVTRFNTIVRPATEETEEREVIRLFEKRALVGEVDIDEAREDWEDALPEFLTNDAKGNPLKAARSLKVVFDFLAAEPGDEEDEEDEDDAPHSIVPEKYRILYGTEQNCGDAIAKTLTAFVTEPRKSKKSPDGGLDRAKLRAVAEENGIGDKLAEWEGRGLNGGLLRMNTSNVLRGMNRRGERVVIGAAEWPAHEVPKKVRKARAKKGGK